MSFVTFGENFALFDTTPVENWFIQEFMLRAPGGHVKVYLYGLMMCYHPSESMSLARMARDLDMTEEEVFSIYQYWERQGLVRRVSDRPARYVYHNLKQQQLLSSGEQESLYKYKDFNETLHNLFEKKRKLYEQDYRRIYEWIEVLDLPETVVIMLIRHLIDSYGVRFSFDKAEAVAREWSQLGVRSIEDAEQQARLSKQQEDDLQKVLRRLGQRRKPSMDEQELYQKWTGEWGFSLEAILTACKETTKGTPTMAYLDGILRRQHQLGRHDATEMRQGIEKERDEKQLMRALYAQIGMPGASPSPEDLQWYASYRDRGFSDEAMVLAAQVCFHNGGKGREGVQQRLESWAARGLLEQSQIESYLREHKKDRQQLLGLFERAGEQRQPGEADKRMLAKWRDQWEMPQEVLLVAAERAVGARNIMTFMDAVLSAWHQKGIRTEAEARAEAQSHAARPAGDGQAQRPVREVAQHRYAQRAYSKEDLEDLFFDPFSVEGDEEEPS